MKKLIAFFLCFILSFTGCSNGNISTEQQDNNSKQGNKTEIINVDNNYEVLTEVDNPDQIQSLSDDIYVTLENEFDNDSCTIENIETVYISKEYLEELEYNSLSNNYFGYVLDNIESEMDGEKYIFTLGEDNHTIVKEFEHYDDTYDKTVKNIAVGTGVILICVTVTIVAGGESSTVGVVFSAAAKTGIELAVVSSFVGGVIAGVRKGLETNDIHEAVKEAVLQASEDFKWGAIIGVVVGGVGKVLDIKLPGRKKSKIPTPAEAEEIAFKKYRGEKQVSYLKGKKVPYSTPDAVRPDIVRNLKGHYEAIEVKNYDLSKSANVNKLYDCLEKQISRRVENLPKDMTQRIVIVARGRNYSKELLDNVVKNLQLRLKDIYPNIPIDVLI